VVLCSVGANDGLPDQENAGRGCLLAAMGAASLSCRDIHTEAGCHPHPLSFAPPVSCSVCPADSPGIKDKTKGGSSHVRHSAAMLLVTYRDRAAQTSADKAACTLARW